MASKKTTKKLSQAVTVVTEQSRPSQGFFASVFRGKIIPLTITFSALLLSIKVVDIVRGTNELSRQFLASDAKAVSPEEEKAAKEAETAKKEEDKPVKDAEKDKAAAEAESKDKKEGEKVAEGDAPKEGDKAAENAPKDAKEGEATSEGEHGGEAKKEEEKPANISACPPRSFEEKDTKKQFSQVEVDILETLSARREQLAKWEEDIKTKERVLDATELRLNKKIDETKTLETSVKTLLEEYKKQEDAKIRSLVKIYENMKPKDAARIFDELDMPVLVLVVDTMSERKVAPILANMNPLNAKKLTMELAEDRKLKEDSEKKLNAISQ